MKIKNKLIIASLFCGILMFSQDVSAQKIIKANAVQPHFSGSENPSNCKLDLTAQSYVENGRKYIEAKNFPLAIANLNKAVAIDPKNGLAYFYLGLAHFYLGDFDASVSNYTKAITFDPGNISSHRNRGLIYFREKNRFDLAEADFNKFVERDPQDASIYVLRADLYESWGKDNLAEADLKKFKSLGGEALPGMQNLRRQLFPASDFDAKAAGTALNYGTATLIGKACVNKGGLGSYVLGGRKFSAGNVAVFLYPVTPYLEKWYQLREKKETKKTGVFLNGEVSKYKLNAVTNSKGEFVFSRLKPGKYFVQLIFNFTERQTRRIYTGSNDDGEVITDYYEDRDFYTDHSDRLEKFIEIKSDGESQKITLKNRGLGGC